MSLNHASQPSNLKEIRDVVIFELGKFKFKFIIIGQTADPNRAPNSTPLNGSYFIVTLDFQRHRVSLGVEVENTFKSLSVSHLRPAS